MAGLSLIPVMKGDDDKALDDDDVTLGGCGGCDESVSPIAPVNSFVLK